MHVYALLVKELEIYFMELKSTLNKEIKINSMLELP